MYTNWTEFLLPKTNGVCSFIINPLFIYIIMKDTKLRLGSYRYLLLYFTIFNMTCSLCDLLVPTGIIDHRYAFSIFISDGFFEERSPLSEWMLMLRCSFIAGPYAILHAHFIYRFLVLFRRQILADYFLPHGLCLSIVYCLLFMCYWIFFCLFLLDNGDLERHLYVRYSMKEVYEKDSMRMPILIALFSESSPETIRSSWISIIGMTVLSVFSVTLYFVLGITIIKKLNSQALELSKQTIRLQRQLMKALVVQSIIPTVVSFFPCLISWYQPIFCINIGKWLLEASVIAISAFPFLDPLALIFYVPTFRNRAIELFGFKKKKKKSRKSTTSPEI